MKFLCITLLALSGLTINAVPTCTDFQVEKTCEKFQPDPDEPPKSRFPKTEEEVDAMCKTSLPMIDCLIEESEKCPDTINWQMIDHYRDQKEYLGYFCTKGSEARTKYLENAKCLETNVEASFQTCRDIIGFEGSECEIYFPDVGCIYSQIYQKCGKDATEVIQLVGKAISIFMKKKCFKEDIEEFIPFRSFPVPFSF